jgi:hypothetical protein
MNNGGGASGGAAADGQGAAESRPEGTELPLHDFGLAAAPAIVFQCLSCSAILGDNYGRTVGNQRLKMICLSSACVRPDQCVWRRVWALLLLDSIAPAIRSSRFRASVQHN